MILVRYGEVALKGKNRSYFVNTLVRNIRAALKTEGSDFVLQQLHGRIMIDTHLDCSVLSRVFGVVSFSRAIECNATLSEMGECVRINFLNHVKDGFRVTCRRQDKKLPFTSSMVMEHIGSILHEETGYSVQLVNSKYELSIEIIGTIAYFFDSKISGPGGLPLGTGGMIVGAFGTEGTVATWSLMKRGCVPVFLNKYDPLLERYTYGNPLRIVRNLPPRARAIVSGEILETFKNVESDLPILRPLIGMTMDEVQKCYNLLA